MPIVMSKYGIADFLLSVDRGNINWIVLVIGIEGTSDF